MNRAAMTFLKGMALGITVGVGMGCACKMIMPNNKQTKKKISSGIKTVSDFMENISYMLR